jgi:hypothetical protein
MESPIHHRSFEGFRQVTILILSWTNEVGIRSMLLFSENVANSYYQASAAATLGYETGIHTMYFCNGYNVYTAGH